MDQLKIGKFIATLRKEKNMTQKMLADKLSISDRAISKWENGRGLPEVSLLQPLCEILDISINELLNGERLSKEEVQNSSEELLYNTLSYSEKKEKKKNKLLFILTTAVIIIVLTFTSLFGIDISLMKENKPVFFSTWGFDYTAPVDFKDIEITSAIKQYLIKEKEKQSKHLNNEKHFVSIHTFLIEENKDIYTVYVWALEESYYLENDTLKMDSGSSLPYKFIVENKDTHFEVIESKIPRDGSYYSADLKSLFPYSVRKKIEKIYSDGTIERLSLEIEEQTSLYYKK